MFFPVREVLYLLQRNSLVSNRWVLELLTASLVPVSESQNFGFGKPTFLYGDP